MDAPQRLDQWRWWSGTSAEWYENGPFETREQAVAELCGEAGYVVEALPPGQDVHFSAEDLISAQYFEDNESFDFDHGEPDRCGPEAAIKAADAELQQLLDAWCEKHAGTFLRGNLFGGTRNEERIEAAPPVANAGEA